jgi:hypothetical protein
MLFRRDDFISALYEYVRYIRSRVCKLYTDIVQLTNNFTALLDKYHVR